MFFKVLAFTLVVGHSKCTSPAKMLLAVVRDLKLKFVVSNFSR